jgi:hypothetical protein
MQLSELNAHQNLNQIITVCSLQSVTITAALNVVSQGVTQTMYCLIRHKIRLKAHSFNFT